METEIADSAGGSEGHDPAQEPVLVFNSEAEP